MKYISSSCHSQYSISLSRVLSGVSSALPVPCLGGLSHPVVLVVLSAAKLLVLGHGGNGVASVGAKEKEGEYPAS